MNVTEFRYAHEDRCRWELFPAGSEQLVRYDGAYVPIQWMFRGDPWKVLTVCILLTASHRRVVRPIVGPLFAAFPTARRMANAFPGQIQPTIRSSGLARIKEQRLVMMSHAYLRTAEHDGLAQMDILTFPGCGQYAADAVEIFCRRLRVSDPSDSVLADFQDSPLGREWLSLGPRGL